MCVLVLYFLFCLSIAFLALAKRIFVWCDVHEHPFTSNKLYILSASRWNTICRFDILGSPISSANHSDDEVDAEASYVEQETAQVPLTPVLQAVFPSPTQYNYYAIPSISSINSVASVQPSPTMATNIPLRTRGQRKRTVDMVTDNMESTNLYSVQETGKSIKVTEEEVLDFLAVNILMGIVVLPSYKDYWKSSFRYPKIAEVMSLKHIFTDNTQADVTDRYYKLRPLIECIRSQCLSLEEENAFSIDEMGFKNLVRAGVSGIIYDFILYAGDDTFRGVKITDEEESLGVGGKIVLALCKTIKKQACSVVYFDNYFTSLDLGTVRKNRLKDAECKMIDDKTLQKKGRGAFTQVVCNENKLSVVKWFDNKHVRLVSTYVDAFPLENIKRFSKESKSRIDIKCLQIVKHYNRHMGGVDLADMLISLYRTGIKSHRWYMNIFSQLLDICLLRRRHDKQINKKRKQNRLKDFRYEIYAGLLKRDRTVPVKDIDSVPERQKIKKPNAERPFDDVRYDKYDHWPQLTGYQRCKYCKGGQASTMCTKCKVHLCYVKGRNCFLAYHTKH
ncbi:hypothetical protein HW555_012897 [Spodoptera exigua]|uniref:PiggyBac transposable element-derived protein domain-containing protein n=1 Tax=Spodoptera exigua TaxID=7107 RepID=A0A835G4C8_SPOEX|nr:hypothetical protein HW555_012897 [Spodoptera exigua]